MSVEEFPTTQPPRVRLVAGRLNRCYTYKYKATCQCQRSSEEIPHETSTLCTQDPLPRSTLDAPVPADVANPETIDDFVGCLNQKLQGQPADISKAVQCLPQGCKFLLTMSPESAQAACTLASCRA